MRTVHAISCATALGLAGWAQASYIAYQPFTNDANTVALYHMDENTGTALTDSSSNANNGGLGSGAWSTDKKFGASAVSYATPTLVSTANDSASFDNIGNQMTVEAWVKVGNTTLGSTSYMVIVSKGDASAAAASNWYLQLRGTGSQIKDSVRVQWNVGRSTSLEATVAFPTDQWVHLSATYSYTAESKSSKIYLNGNLITAPFDPGVSVVPANNEPFRIHGMANRGNAAGTSLLIDELRISNIDRGAPNTVPEPTGAASLLMGGGALLARRRRMTRK